jgi:hypothetical protein
MYIQANVDAWVVLRKNQMAQEETLNVYTLNILESEIMKSFKNFL